MSILYKRDSAGELHRLAGEDPQMLGRSLPANGLVKQSPAGADGAVAADHPVARRSPADAERLGHRELRRHLRSVSVRGLDGVLVDRRGDRVMRDARSAKHLPSDSAR